jgi:hypothetical protein
MNNTEKLTIEYAGRTLHQLDAISESAFEAADKNHIDEMQTRLDRLKTSGVVACWTHHEDDHILYSELPPLEDLTGGNLIESMKYADTLQNESLKRCIERLRMVDKMQGTKTIIFDDYSNHSFEFARWKEREDNEQAGTWVQHQDGKFYQLRGNGGVIFHGVHDNGGDGSAPTFSVSLTPVNGWSIHT